MDLYILKRGKTPIGLEGFVIVLDQYVLLLSLEYTEPSCHYLIGSTLPYLINDHNGIADQQVQTVQKN